MSIDAFPDWWSYRPDTWDQVIFKTVAVQNEYRLPARFARSDVIMDVGAHIGSFALAVWARGARHIYAYEAEPSNAALLSRNARPMNIRVVQAAVWRSDEIGADDLCYLASQDKKNTGGGGIVHGNSGLKVPLVRFDDCVNEASRGGQRRIKYLKLDCEGSEFEILPTSKRLHLIDNICGEYHLPEPPSSRTWGVLEQCLQRAGFEIHCEPCTPVIGHFWAQRPTGAASSSTWQRLRGRLRHYWNESRRSLSQRYATPT